MMEVLMPGWVHSVLRLFPRVRVLESENGRLTREVERLSDLVAEAGHQQDALVAERDELRDHSQRLTSEAREAWRHHSEAAAERDAERATAARLQAEVEDLGRTLGSVIEERDRLRIECAEQHQARAQAEAQRDVLEAERDDLKRALAPILAERDALQAELREQHAARQQAQDQRDRLALERDQLKSHAARLDHERAEMIDELRRSREETARLLQRTWVEPGHFYSPIVNPDDRFLNQRLDEMTRFVPADPLRIPVNDATQLESVRMVARHAPHCPFPDTQTPGFRYFFDNPAFSAGDAITLFAILREFQPKRIIEVGCGFSSAAMLDAHPNASTLHIDPHPEILLDLLEPGDPARARVRRQCVQEVPDQVFEELAPGDLLFIDSSHVMKAGSDVHDLLFRVLPLLARGTLIHVHDIFYPFEYPRDWIARENRSWNEAYALRALLTGNPGYHVLLWNDYAYQRFPQVTPERLRHERGGSIWITKS
jgi:predicted O-methyltransferase YrrM